MTAPSLLFLCSGGGGNLRFVHRVLQMGWLTRWRDISVIVDRECPAAVYSRESSFDTLVADFTEPGQLQLARTIAAKQPEVIITTVNRILHPAVLSACSARLINLHYSLLPAFSGTIGVAPMRSAMAYGANLVGVTVHEVSVVLDGGRPLVQVAIPIGPEDSEAELMNAIFRAGCMALLAALKNVESNSLASWRGAHLIIKDRSALMNPSVDMPPMLFDEQFWRTL
jgi:phosphoribosylglycinamide formyltransferase 1